MEPTLEPLTLFAFAWASSLVKNFEGCRLTEYCCAAGRRTIGYGHRIESHQKGPLRISHEMAEALLQKDLRSAYLVLRRLSPRPLQPFQEAALLSFIFNVGGGAYQRSQVRQRVNREEHEAVPEALSKWVYGAGQPLRGLKRRRYYEGLTYRGLIGNVYKYRWEKPGSAP